jgi:hypothetical protein
VKVTGSCRKTPEIAGTWKQYSDRKFSGFFQTISCAFRKELAGNHWKKSEKFQAGILLPQNHRDYRGPSVLGRCCSTWLGDFNQPSNGSFSYFFD